MTPPDHEPVRAYQSDRRFQVWRYQMEHSQLLIRSVKGDDYNSRIDVLFKAVSAIHLPTEFDGLIINAQGDLYTAGGQAWSGSVSAQACFVAEDQGEYFDASPFEASF